MAKKRRVEYPEEIRAWYQEWGKMGGRPRVDHVEGCRCVRCRKEAGGKKVVKNRKKGGKEDGRVEHSIGSDTCGDGAGGGGSSAMAGGRGGRGSGEETASGVSEVVKALRDRLGLKLGAEVGK